MPPFYRRHTLFRSLKIRKNIAKNEPFGDFIRLNKVKPVSKNDETRGVRIWMALMNY